jgi:hypothetical protein
MWEEGVYHGCRGGGGRGPGDGRGEEMENLLEIRFPYFEEEMGVTAGVGLINGARAHGSIGGKSTRDANMGWSR